VVGLLPFLLSFISAGFIGDLAVTETESRPRNRALVASFLFTDLVGYSKGTAAEQYAAKATLSEILSKNLAALRKDDYRVKDTGDGALIAFLSNPEHALYMALAIAQDFARAAQSAGFPSNSVRTGLHIGAVKEAIDLEERPNFVGDGINAAKRIMDFAAPGRSRLHDRTSRRCPGWIPHTPRCSGISARPTTNTAGLTSCTPSCLTPRSYKD
jgi:class 3 adenylate cyclase